MSTAEQPSKIKRFVSPRQLKAATGLSIATQWRMRQRGELPAPVRLSPGRVGWDEDIIVAWQASRAPAQLTPLADDRETP